MTVSPGTKIRELRIISNMSQEELGRRVGVQRAAIQKYEKGTVENIPIKTIEKMATVFDVSPTYIVGWDDSIGNQLAVEVRIIQGIKRFFGSDSVELLEAFVSLSKTGRKRVLQYTADMWKLYGEDL